MHSVQAVKKPERDVPYSLQEGSVHKDTPSLKHIEAKHKNVPVVYKLRDISQEMVNAWENYFRKYPDRIQVCL